MKGSIGAFLRQEGWFQRRAKCEESIVIFYVLYNAWCALQGLTPIEGDALYSELRQLGLPATGEYVRGLKLTESGAQIAAMATATMQEQEGDDDEEDPIF